MPMLAIVGPTASGKSDLAMALARRIGIEIVVADSRQAYTGMDVGTAKPDADARAAVPHHLLDLVAPDEPFTVAQWVEHARDVVPAIAARDRMPVLVGGTGLYVAALVDGHDYAAQPWSPEVRNRLEAELEAAGLEALAGRLERLDPDVAARIDRANPRRVLRALERAELGMLGTELRLAPAPGPVRLIGIRRPREVLYRRIDARATAMFTQDGLLREVEGLVARGYGPWLRPVSGHGYREAVRHLSGEWGIERAIEVTARRTRQYAKRQVSWFGRDVRITWIDAEDRPADDPEIVERATAVAVQLTEDSPID
ncbi:MAG: tRNA (adenosine(37)-N6)-dimethylallyltransferase MiaA [Chloroflexi bacterium]|nr:tRNA (adenosine(37)-N6)-dimethylallyltransferase MiaA [Chloroflexota bacterium]